MSRGMSVRTANMIGHYNEFLRDPNVSGLVPEVAGVSEDRARMWAMRWRRRFGSRCGSLRVEVPVALDEKREKA